jgi:hypothetical protein
MAHDFRKVTKIATVVIHESACVQGFTIGMRLALCQGQRWGEESIHSGFNADGTAGDLEI